MAETLSAPLLTLKLQSLIQVLLYEAPLLSSLYYPKVNDDFKSSFYIHGSPLASSILIHLASFISISSQIALTLEFYPCWSWPQLTWLQWSSSLSQMAGLHCPSINLTQPSQVIIFFIVLNQNNHHDCWY